MGEEKFIMFRNRLEKLKRHRGRQAKRTGIECYRLYDHDIPEFPFAIDMYGDKAQVAEYKRRHGLTEDEHSDWLEKSIRVIRETLQLPEGNIFLKLRERKAGRQAQYQKLKETDHEFIVRENGLRFLVNLDKYLDTGLFPDHRITRTLVRELALQKQVLNLFSYTGSFSVYAAAGSAAGVTSVDLSKTYLDWAKRNMQLNGFEDESRYSYVQADVKSYLASLREESFDLVILDPPTFSNSKRMEGFLDIQRDHAMLVNACLHIMKSGGTLFFSTNFKGFQIDKVKIQSSQITDITKATTPFDFEGKLFRFCFRIIKE